MTEVSNKNKTALSDPGTYTDEPPRLSVCINEVDWGGDRSKPEDERGNLSGARVPNPEALFTAEGAEWLSELVQWIVDGCLTRIPGPFIKKSQFDQVWDNAVAARNDRYAEYDDGQKTEERWARKVEECFWGIAYGGPNITASIPTLPKDDTYDESPDIGSQSVMYIYQRFQPKNLDWAIATSSKWWKGVPEEAKDDASWHVNSDPCYSIWMACQFLATYINQARGFTVEQHMNRFGFGAGQCAHFEVFNHGGGRWYGTAPKNPKLPHGHVDKSAGPAACIELATTEGGPGLNPGSIFTFNPYGDTKVKEVVVPVEYTRYDNDQHCWVVDRSNKAAVKHSIQVELQSANQLTEHNKQIEKDTAAAKKLEQTYASPKGYFALVPLDTMKQFVAPLAGQEKKDLAKRDSVGDVTAAPVDPTKKEQEKLSGETRLALLTLGAQAPGSHIYAILRRWKKKDGSESYQVLDTNSHPETLNKQGEKIEATKAREYSLWQRTSNRGIYCGHYTTQIGGHFVGFGAMPAVESSSLEEMMKHLDRSRPVGIARLVISRPETSNPKAPGIPPTLTPEDILYISRGAVMWGDRPTANYSMAKYALSLRNTPYYEDLQAFWLIYAPSQELARVMFAEGARKKDLATLVKEANAMRAMLNETKPADKRKEIKYIQGQAISLTTVLTHDSKGLSRVVWRGNCMTGMTGEGMPSKAIKSLFMDTAVAFMPIDPAKLTDLQRVQRDLLIEYIHPGFTKNGVTAISVSDYLTGAAPDAAGAAA